MENKSYQCFKFSNLLSLLIIFYASQLFFSQLVVVVSGQSWDGIIVTQSDLQSLQAIKHDLVDPRGRLRTWNGSGSEACSGRWVGIKCLKGQVIAVQLPWKGLGGRISEKIGQLQALRRLSLHDNFISGNVPWSLSFLPNLRGVYLFNNRLSGSVPPSIGNLPLLQTIDLSNNSLVGPVPLGLGNSSRLFRVNLSFNLLSGSIPVTLVKSRSLTILALQHNLLSGNIPIYWSNSSKLQILTLDHNNFTGPIPLSLSNLTELKVLDFSNNAINGTLPENLSNLSSLVTLNLGQNKLSGPIPESFTKLANLSSFNVSHNNLSSSVPSLLAERFNSSSFVGNLQLCGFSNETLCKALSPRVLPTLPPEESPKSHKNKPKKLSTKDILLIAAGALLVILLLLCCFLLCCFLRKRASSNQRGDGDQKASRSVSVPPEVQSGGESGGKLVHFDGPFVFTADDLLCATAEIMGKSSYGTSYKATLEDGSQVAVKRLREKTTKGLKEFEAEVAVLGKIRHPNLVALRAYYLGPKGEKLLVFDYMPKGSLASFLHARGPETIIDWSTRMTIAAGVTRGLLHLHEEENTVHGNLTSTNILLDERTRAHIADTGLARLMTAPSSAQSSVIATTAGSQGYNAPELTKTKKSTQKTDVYSLGVVILELLTGKSPGEPVASNGMDLPQWVASIVKEEWTNEVFDLDLMRDGLDIGDELLNTLKLALHCVDPSPEARPEVRQVLSQLEEIKPDVVVSHEQATTAAKNDE